LVGTIQAVQHVRRMRGGAQSHLMRCNDGHFYVVKFQNNPQHLRVLANELLGTRLGERLGLSVPATRVVEVTDWLIDSTPEMHVARGGRFERCTPGFQFGARFVADPFASHVFDYLPAEHFDRVGNLREFAGVLCFDKWTCNANGRQAVFSRRLRERKYRATFIDQGYCFNAGEWNFPDAPMRGVYNRNEVYAEVNGWESFEPWLSIIEQMPTEVIAECADGIPPEWLTDTDEFERLLEQLFKRRGRIREFIEAFRVSSRDPFPAWNQRLMMTMN
jgi:hypothetical protein